MIDARPTGSGGPDLTVLMPYPDGLPTVHGLTVSMHRQAVALRRLGVRAVVAPRRPLGQLRAPARIDDVEYRRWLPRPHHLARELVRFGAPWFPDRYLHLELAAVRRIARAVQPDVLHVREPYGTWTGLAMRERVGIPFVLSLHTFSPLYHKQLRWGRQVDSDQGRRWTDWLVGQQRRVPLIIAVSHDVADRYVAAGLERHRFRVIHHGVPDAFFTARDDGAMRRRLGLGRQDVVTLVAGRLEESKGQRDVVDAFASIVGRGHALSGGHALGRAPARSTDGRLRLVLLGGGANYEAREAAHLRRQAARLGVEHDVSIDALPPDQIPSAIAAAQVVVVATRLYEGFGLPAAEAAAGGRPVVATRVGALPEIVEDGVTGVLVPPRDPTALARALEQLLTDPDARERLGAAARARARTAFTLDRCGRDHVAVYRAACSSA